MWPGWELKSRGVREMIEAPRRLSVKAKDNCGPDDGSEILFDH
jgi:hypothetical protein